ncbi:hypothetical protein [Thalassoglobus neptunius]|nr:hypothetical protein [Thalassoglobus neptunius]
MRFRRTNRSQNLAQRAGFTLVEMLVSTALVVLIMLMFAQIYGSAVGSITEQRGLANNDQKARQFDTTIRRDLQSMTFRQPSFPYGEVRGIVPLGPGDGPIVDPANQRGFLYYSENDFNDQTDDVLHLTTMVKIGQRGDAESKDQRQGFVGRAANLAGTDTNQPDADDGEIGNGLGLSRAAEVVYFMRNGNLYRRQLLLRDPLPVDPRFDPQPTRTDGLRRFRFDPASGSFNNGWQNYAGDFLDDFDYSATRVYSGTEDSYLWFNSVDSLANHVGFANVPMAIPWNRFGHFNNFSTTNDELADHGSPREYADQSDPTTFIGRLTQEETSNAIITYPGSVTLTGPQTETYAFRRTSVPATAPIIDRGALNGLNGGPRVGEDIVLTNVESFDVEIYDSEVGRFVDIGNNDTGTNNGTTQFQTLATPGGSEADDRLNVFYGPRRPADGVNRVFDTWHPNAEVVDIATSGLPLPANPTTVVFPPFRPLRTTNINPVDAWAPTTAATFGEVIYVPALNPNIGVDPINRSMFYTVVSGGTTGELQPEFPPIPGTTVQDGSVTWQCIDNRIGIQGLRITVRYRDQRSTLPRQLTIVHSFVE